MQDDALGSIGGLSAGTVRGHVGLCEDLRSYAAALWCDRSTWRCFSCHCVLLHPFKLTGSACRRGLQNFLRRRSQVCQHHSPATATLIALTCCKPVFDALERCIVKNRAGRGPSCRGCGARSGAKRHRFLALCDGSFLSCNFSAFNTSTVSQICAGSHASQS